MLTSKIRNNIIIDDHYDTVWVRARVLQAERKYIDYCEDEVADDYYFFKRFKLKLHNVTVSSSNLGVHNLT